jgi:hypothetical protein
MNLDPIIRAVHKAVGVESDGKPGTDTWKAIYRKVLPGK